jgi:hemolysin activation/secretion protein
MRCSYHLMRLTGAALAVYLAQPEIAFGQSLDGTEHRLPPPPALRDEPAVAPPALEAAQAPQPEKSAEFAPLTLTAVVIRGATVFEASEFAALYDPYLARRVTLADLASIADAITNKYRQAGYFLSRAVIPPQSIEGGLVRIEIIEGYIDTITLEGAPNRKAKDIGVAALRDRPIKLAQLERAILLINDLNGVTVSKSALYPDANDLRRHTMVLTLEGQDAQARLYLDNRGTEDVGRLQMYLQGGLHSIVRAADMLTGGLFFTPSAPRELLFGQIAYSAPLGDDGLTVTVYGARSAVHPDRAPPLQSESHSIHSLIRLSYPIVRNRRLSLWGNVGFETRNVREDQPDAIVYKDRLRDVTLSAYAIARHGGGASTAYAELVNGVSGSQPDGAPRSRADADGRFTKARFELTRSQRLHEHIETYVAVSGQISNDALLSSEEFAFGGVRYGRGFDPAAITGDDGVAGVVELRFLGEADWAKISSYQIFTFYDAGALWNKDSSLGQYSLSSAGVGVRLVFDRNLQLTYEAARPIDGFSGTLSDERWRHFFSFSKAF